MIQYGEIWVCAACKPIYFQKLKEGIDPGAARPPYPLFARVMFIIDLVCSALRGPIVLLGLVGYADLQRQGQTKLLPLITFVIATGP